MRRIAVMSLTLSLAALLAAAGCGSGDKPKAAKTPAAGAADCGKVDAAGGAPAYLKVTKGSAPCADAVSVYKAFFAEVADGKAPGQGSGGGLAVQGWSCVIYPPDKIQQNGRGADCTKGGTTVTAFQNAH
ncbi:hypothetical protein NE236_41005 [Actinoallomurus purpureus]|uniref:hypothetical protein n=1 Tax=Actinoallomurus purpureus TaxID=478114 RepID=UPI0020924AE9|nr:hypothetical protein [Actinoallomurus purpureus]MCO6011347.1 hypothetical protein [Actinoallomurus purpureus]